ncbi:MAG: isoleucine--tRNA ligase [Candidatus Aenigmatarchaeota archaeon]
MVITEVKGQYNPNEIENRIRNFWEKNKIPQKLQADLKKKKFYLLDGPPYVNQVAHVGHIKTTTAKDVWAKFKQMQGFNVWLQPGFDTHGLPIENMVERELNITSKQQIEEMGIDKFMKICRSHAEDMKNEWLKLYKQLGAWRGWFEPYLTYKNYFIESGWWTIKRLYEKGMLVEGEKPTFWCPHCETALAGYEVTDSYADIKDPSIYVKFRIKGKQNEYLLVWTTTPWTLVSNVAIAVHPNEYYVKAKMGNDILILAEKRVKIFFENILKKKYEIIEKFLGKELEGLKYEPCLDVPIQQKLKLITNTHQVILSIPVMVKEKFQDFVTMEEGTGLVHTAPGHGPEDYMIGQHYNLPVVSPINNEGKFTNDAGEFRELFVKEADKLIIERLQKNGLLVKFDWVIHSYPLCWRCKSPLIYRLSKQWFLKVDMIKSKMIKENEKVNWLPEWGKERFHNWLIGATDWCISRQRYWGIPLPIWVCEKCKAKDVIGSVEELRRRAIKKLPKDIDLHRNVVDKIELACKNCNGRMKRIPDILDVWFDSGIAPWASLGYPYNDKEKRFEELWPVDLVCESQDQIRGWFYSLMFCGVATFDRSPYNSVGLMGWVVDEKGEKMSKSLGNVIWAKEALQKLSADIIRLYYCWEVPLWEVQKFSFKTAEEIVRAVNILWNTYSFFTTYVDKNFKPKLTALKIEDKWLLSKLNSLIEEVLQHYEKFEFHEVGRKIVNFVVNDISRFYIKLIRDRVWITEKGADKNAALSTLYTGLVTVAKLLAPITPFISEEIYQNLVLGLNKKEKPSIFLSILPKVNKKLIDKNLEQEIEIGRKIIEKTYAARQAAGIKLRWPIRHLYIKTMDKKALNVARKLEDILIKLCNVKEVKVIEEKTKEDFAIEIDKELDEKLIEEAMIRELIREIQNLRKQNKFSVKQTIDLTLNSNPQINKVLKNYEKIISKEVGAKNIQIGSLKGKYKGQLIFEDQKILIQFE